MIIFVDGPLANKHFESGMKLKSKYLSISYNTLKRREYNRKSIMPLFSTKICNSAFILRQKLEYRQSSPASECRMWREAFCNNERNMCKKWGEDMNVHYNTRDLPPYASSLR